MTDPTAAAAERLRRELDRKQYIAYRDVRVVINAYFAEHQSDDGEPIAGWIDSEFVYPEGMDDWKRNIVERWIDKMPNATRGQLKLLLRALSQEPQP